MVDLFNCPKFRLTKSVFSRARAVNQSTHVYQRMSKLKATSSLLLRFRLRFSFFSFFFLFLFFWCYICACKFMPARQFYNYTKNELQIKTFFPQFPVGIELATSESTDQCLIHWTTAASVDFLLQKLIFNCQARSQGPRIFSRWRPLFRASSKCLRPVPIMLATATPQSPAMKRPIENLEL